MILKILKSILNYSRLPKIKHPDTEEFSHHTGNGKEAFGR
jgi:hypothetical protein